MKGGPGGEPFVGFLRSFWDDEESSYVKEKLAHGQRIGRCRCHEGVLAVRKHYAPHLGDRRLEEITHRDLQDFVG